MSYEINRAYAHRVYGDIGSVAFSAPGGDYVLNGNKLPESSVRHLLTFALQTLQDAYAGAKNADEAIGAFDGKLDKIIAGTLGTRSGGSGMSERDKIARQTIRAWFTQEGNEDVSAKNLADYKAADAAGRDAMLDKIWADNHDVFGGAVDDEIAARKAKAEKLDGLKVKISI